MQNFKFIDAIVYHQKNEKKTGGNYTKSFHDEIVAIVVRLYEKFVRFLLTVNIDFKV